MRKLVISRHRRQQCWLQAKRRCPDLCFNFPSCTTSLLDGVNHEGGLLHKVIEVQKQATIAYSGFTRAHVAYSSKPLGKLPQKRSHVISSVPRLPYICSRAEPKLRHHQRRSSGLRMTWWGPICLHASLHATSCATRLPSTALARCMPHGILPDCKHSFA